MTNKSHGNISMNISTLLGTLVTYLKSNGLRMVMTLLDFTFIMGSLYPAMLGLQRLLPVLNRIDAEVTFNFLGSLLMSSIALAFIRSLSNTQGFITNLCVVLVFISVTILGFLGLEFKYLYFLIFYLILATLIKAIPWIYRRTHALS